MKLTVPHRVDRVMQSCLALLLVMSAGLLSVSSAGAVDATNATEAREPRLGLAVVDANPRFLDGLELPLKKGALRQAAPELRAGGVIRRGVAADGVSLLLLKATFAQPGTAAFSLKADAPTGELGGVSDLQTRPDRVATLPLGGGLHAAFALYRPPMEFGQEHAGENVFSRELEIEVRFQPSQGKAIRRTAVLRIVRPPVVLVHGMYHGPRTAWQTRPPGRLGKLTMESHLRSRGFRLFLVDYEKSNGKRFAGPSRFRDNQMVVWEGRGGIRDALRAYRDDRLAVTQADVVGHSMGGLLARAYAMGKRLPKPKKPEARATDSKAPGAKAPGSRASAKPPVGDAVPVKNSNPDKNAVPGKEDLVSDEDDDEDED